MKKIVKFGFPIVCVAIIIFTFWLMSDMKDKVDDKKSDKEEIEENVNEISENEIVENAIGNKDYNEIGLDVNQTNNKTESSFFSNEGDIYLNKAIQVLRDKIKINENQYFTSEGEEEGRYIVALRNSETTEAEIYYIVDIETGFFEIYY